MSNVVEFRVWVGCLGCYNAGHLAGVWIDAEDIEMLFDPGAHDAGLGVRFPGVHFLEGHEEYECFDTENSPTREQLGLVEASRWASAMGDHEVTEDELEALQVFVKRNFLDSPETYVREFRESYKGEFESKVSYAQEWAHDVGDIPEHLWSFIDWEFYARETFMGWDIVEVAHNRAFVFECI